MGEVNILKQIIKEELVKVLTESIDEYSNNSIEKPLVSEALYFDEDKMLKLIMKDKFLKYMSKSKYRGKAKTKDLEDMFNTFIKGDRDMEKKYRKIR